ncbi:hypothetical protein HU200_014644 [Digitaria exilis]|uniref:PROP1-like PPR domain-containing protein n=1 Tax=Digitaria exilis TaxID=1010633 RepID=A0A835FBA1_9POAL|nr:hypothetical protein HU200_014644 [Digitaria exilis]
MRAGAVARVRRPRPLPEPARPSVSPAARANTEKAPIPLNLPLKAFKLRLANGAPLAPTAKAFKAYAETCASLLRLCRHTAADASNLPSFSVSSALQLVLSLHAHALRSGLGSDCSVASNLLTAYAAFGRSVDRDRAFDDCVTSVAFFTAIIAGFVRNELHRDALPVFRKMLSCSVRPNVVTLICVIKACVGAGEFDLAMSVVGLAIKWNLFEKSIEVHNSLITLYLRMGDAAAAHRVFDEMERNAVSWGTLIARHEQKGDTVEAVRLYNQMLVLSSGQIPGKITLSSVLLACANLCSLEMGKMVHAKIVKLGIEDDIFLGTALSDMYAKSGDLDSSKTIFYQMPEKNNITWTAMVQGLAENGFAEESILLFENMMANGISPNEHTFLAILFACSHSGLVEQAIHYFEKMQTHGIPPKEKHYTCMVDVLARAGRLKEAEELLMKVPSNLEANSWSALLSACNTYSNKEIGERAAKRLHELEKDNTAGYVLLSNMYASCGKWKDAAEMRILMKGASLKKDGGCSWLQLRGQYHAFFSWEAKHPLSLEIYEILDLLMWELTT